MEPTPSSLLNPTSPREERPTVFIRDFTHPGDSDSAAGIRKAIQEAIRIGARRIQFEKGHYRLISHVEHETEGIVHDAGSRGTPPRKECHLLLQRIPNLTLSGIADAQGTPLTTLVGWNEEKNHPLLPAILWSEHCTNLRIENLAFTRAPTFTSAGEVIEGDDTGVTVRPFTGCPIWDGMGAYCANQFSPDGETLLGESISYGNGAQSTWKKIGAHEYRLVDPRAAKMTQRGNLLSWHQGARTDFQVYFGHCDNLSFENLRTANSNGFCFLTESCRGIVARNVSFRPDGDRLFTGPRDAWKIFKCGGHIAIDGLSVRGVRMDGQNMHSNWATLRKLEGEREALFFCRYTYAPITIGSVVDFHRGPRTESRVVESARLEDQAKDEHLGYLYRVRFTEGFPDFAGTGTLCAFNCWEAESYQCRNSRFSNIAGAGHLVRYDHLTLHNNRYENIMNPGILLGAEMPTHAEGGHATDVLIRQCEFDNCGFYPRYDTVGCVGIHSAGFDLPLNRDILITENTFRNSEVGIHLMTARNVEISRNRYDGIREPVRVDASSTTSINLRDS
ncbi:right-handed parallel beta-helix repeat-containing protein [Puniceicoccus vermicola]|uniref:Right-handed parallel beta-helix repeat-containing protein n=1 Tax=Puniceicoccus vermicola TaxID=388746 RepID=A0A7X1E4H8_9BACT|nr:right-handed parallel beta-helix repeat-containing protein [Puniceicoccus vermicola]MBC2602166.1 right-handed parallel beta-helix repeat-containing protein [Puniceicoccus vermicola]